MSRSPTKAEDFLKAMQAGEGAPEPPAPPIVASEPVRAPVPLANSPPRAAKPSRKAKPAISRADLKHFGGYLDDDTLEKIALLRIRLKMDNSELIKHAIDELHRKHSAKRAFGDA